MIAPQYAADFIARMPVESFWGVGPVTAAKMHALGIYTGEDLRHFSIPELRLHFGKASRQYHDFARGIDNRPVEAYRVRKSVGCEHTYDHDITNAAEIKEQLAALSAELEQRLANKNFNGSTLTLKIRFSDFTNLSRSLSGIEPNPNADTINTQSLLLLEKADIDNRPVRLLGLTLSIADKNDTSSDPRQLHLDFDD